MINGFNNSVIISKIGAMDEKTFRCYAEGCSKIYWGTLLHKMYNYFAFEVYSVLSNCFLQISSKIFVR